MLHPQAQAWLDFLKARGVPPTHTLSVADARPHYRAVAEDARRHPWLTTLVFVPATALYALALLGR